MTSRYDPTKKLLAWKPVAAVISFSKKFVIPGFDGVPIYDVAEFFFKGLNEGYITTRASAISYSFFIAIFPTLIFFFTIIPFIPIQDFQQSLLGLIRAFLPRTTYVTVSDTLEDIITRPRSGLLSIGFVLSLYFATNGINSLIEGFNSTVHSIETRRWIKQRLISIMLLAIISFLLIISIGLISFGTTFLELALPDDVLDIPLVYTAILSTKWLITLGALFLGISSIYYFAPAKKLNFRFISAGSSLATGLIILTTLGFNFYVDHFIKYNILYGSIGTLLVLMLWIYINSFSLLIGFELDASIYQAKKSRKTMYQLKHSRKKRVRS